MVKSESSIILWQSTEESARSPQPISLSTSEMPLIETENKIRVPSNKGLSSVVTFKSKKTITSTSAEPPVSAVVVSTEWKSAVTGSETNPCPIELDADEKMS